VLVHARHDRVVDDAAVAVADQHVLGLADGTLRQVTRRQQLGKAEAVRTGHLQAALNRHVPHCDVVEQRLELGLEGVEADGEEHVVVDGEADRAVLLRRFVVRAAPQAGTALDQAHVEFGHLWPKTSRNDRRSGHSSGPAPPRG
jgi:hypothetical protein